MDDTRTITKISAELATAKREYRAFRARVGDDMGCDGTGGEAADRRGDIKALESELVEARAAKAAKKNEVK